jgi:predicted DNA-binding protein
VPLNNKLPFYTTTIRIGKVENNALNKLREREGMTRSAWIRFIIRREYEQAFPVVKTAAKHE